MIKKGLFVVAMICVGGSAGGLAQLNEASAQVKYTQDIGPGTTCEWIGGNLICHP